MKRNLQGTKTIPVFLQHQLRLALAAALLSLLALAGAERTAAQTNRQPIWGSPGKGRAASQLGWRSQSQTNVASRAVARAASSGRKVLAEVGPNHRSWRTEPDDSAGAPTNRFARARAANLPWSKLEAV